MKHTSADLLEFEDLRALVGRYISSPLGRTALQSVEPGADRTALEMALAEAAEAIEYLRASTPIALSGLNDVTESVQKLRIEGAGLDGQEIASLQSFLERATGIRAALVAEGDDYPLLAARAARLGDFRTLLRDVTGKVLGNGTVADDASVALNRLRRDIEKQQRLIQQSLERFLRKHRDEGILQEEYVTIRNERFVVPVVAGQRRRVDGVIHGASSTGQTLFVEPLDTIDLNNELVRLMEEEAREVARILREITTRLRAEAPQIRTSLEEIRQFDLVFAKAAFAKDFECVIPRFTGRVHLKGARHPLLQDILRRQKGRIVPVSLTLGDGTHTLLISGPNTGGKTVSMKTVGLLALMAHSGLPVPAEEAEFPVFDQVLADIGDQQSIEQSLSTFSAHIAAIREMILDATPQSLILLDELGRATDPEEGGALGVAILEHFRQTGCIVLASTHLLALKVYGANTPSVLNGSMGFDDATLEPTYVLRLGAPGKSAGLSIAERLGLPPHLLERARAALSTTERDIAKFLSELHERIAESNALNAELRKQLAEVEARRKQLEADAERREKARLREIERKFDELVARFDTQARETIESLHQSADQRKAAGQAQRKVAKARREMQEQMEAELLPQAPAEQAAPTRRIEEGVHVVLKGIRQPARVRRILNDGYIEVDAGLMKMKVPASEVDQVLDAAEQEALLPKGVTFQSGPRWDTTFRELNVIGHRADEAVDEVDKFLDHAAMASVARLRIVHGHGMGVLKRAISDLLARSPHVEKFYAASPSEGGTGATIVELKTA